MTTNAEPYTTLIGNKAQPLLIFQSNYIATKGFSVLDSSCDAWSDYLGFLCALTSFVQTHIIAMWMAPLQHRAPVFPRWFSNWLSVLNWWEASLCRPCRGYCLDYRQTHFNQHNYAIFPTWLHQAIMGGPWSIYWLMYYPPFMKTDMHILSEITITALTPPSVHYVGMNVSAYHVSPSIQFPCDLYLSGSVVVICSWWGNITQSSVMFLQVFIFILFFIVVVLRELLTTLPSCFPVALQCLVWIHKLSAEAQKHGQNEWSQLTISYSQHLNIHGISFAFAHIMTAINCEFLKRQFLKPPFDLQQQATSLEAQSLLYCLSRANCIFNHMLIGQLEKGLLTSLHVVACTANTCVLMYINRQGVLFDPHFTDLDQQMFSVTHAHTCPWGDECSHTCHLCGKYPGQSRQSRLSF